MVFGLGFRVWDVECWVYGVWCVVCGVWCVVCGVGFGLTERSGAVSQRRSGGPRSSMAMATAPEPTAAAATHTTCGVLQSQLPHKIVILLF